MNVLIIGLLVFIITFILFMLASFKDTWKDRKVFQQVFDSLPSKTFYKNFEHVYSHSIRGVDDGFIWFTDDNDFRLTKKVDLYNMHYSFLNPYHHYWLRKYRNWFAENVDLKQLSRYSQS